MRRKYNEVYNDLKNPTNNVLNRLRIIISVCLLVQLLGIHVYHNFSIKKNTKFYNTRKLMAHISLSHPHIQTPPHRRKGGGDSEG